MAQKKIDPQHMLPPHIPFYRTRKFWGVVVGAFFIGSIFFYFFQFFNSGDSFIEITYDLIYAFGLSFPLLFGYEFFGEVGGWVGLILYLTLMIYLLLQTFKTPLVIIKYPLLFVVLYITSVYTTMLFIGSFV